MHKVNAHPGSHNQTLRYTCLILSYKLSLINCLISKLALSVRMEWWNGRTFGAVASLFLISVSWSWYVFKGREGSWIANTFTTHSPSLKEVKYIKLLVNKKKKMKDTMQSNLYQTGCHWVITHSYTVTFSNDLELCPDAIFDLY